MADAKQHTESRVTGYTLELSPDEAGVLLALLEKFVSGPLTMGTEELGAIRHALQAEAVQVVALHNANAYKAPHERKPYAILSRG